jgi:hypothetical protein
MDIFHKPLAELTLLDLGKVAAWIIAILVLIGIVVANLDSWLEKSERPLAPKNGVQKIFGGLEPTSPLY